MARLVLNSRTGTTGINRSVRVGAAAVSHGTLMVRVEAFNDVSQPGPGDLAQGDTVEVTNAEITVEAPTNQMVLLKPGVGLQDIVDPVNQAGASPSSLLSILDALQRAGNFQEQLGLI